MKKTSTVLISLILLSTLSILSANLVSATVGVANFLPGTYIPDEDDGPDTPEEVTLSQSTYNYITSAMYNKYPGDVAFAVNFTYSTYLSTLSTLQSYYDDIIVFSKGHRGYPAWPATNHISLLDYNRVGLPDDAGYYNNTDIYSVTSSKNLITFI